MEEKKKDNTWLYIGAIIAAVIVLVIMFKSREVSSIPAGYDETQERVKKQMQNY